MSRVQPKETAALNLPLTGYAAGTLCYCSDPPASTSRPVGRRGKEAGTGAPGNTGKF